MQACRDQLLSVNRQAAAHPGLLLDRYLRISVQDQQQHPLERRELFGAMQSAIAGTLDVYRSAFDRWKSFVLHQAKATSLVTTARTVIGLGGSNVLETGLTLHRTYGVPVIPGSAIKGLAAHYCDRVWGDAEPEFMKRVEYQVNGATKYRVGASFAELFGATGDAGHITFFDAWITPDSLTSGDRCLALDVMTPHHGDYYSDAKNKIAPTDFDDPNPVTFLSVSGEFVFALCCDVGGETDTKWSSLALELVTEALGKWGIGGKTSSGYGRLVPPEQITSAQRTSRGTEPPSRGADTQASAKPKHQRGDKVTITRLDKTTKKGAPIFATEDGTEGFFQNEEPSNIDIGNTTEAWIANTGATLAFTMREIKPKQTTQKKGKGGRPR